MINQFDHNQDIKISNIKVLNENLHKSIFGQDKAIKLIVDKIIISEAGLSDTHKPKASFLFTGPTGVGKTELAIELAKNLNLHFERFDMSEYSSDHSVSTLIGAASGLKGYEEGGILTKAIKKNPKCVLLLDEIEKADKSILNTFLQVLDYGVLTDTKGDKIEFKNVIIIMTSNLGATAKGTVGFNSNSKSNKDDAVNKFLSPELRARIDCQIDFNPLTKEMVENITNKFLAQLSEKLKIQNKIMTLTVNAIEEINNQAFNSKLGARYISKIINDTIKQRLAYELLFGKFKENDHVVIDFINDSKKQQEDEFIYLFDKKEQSTLTKTDSNYFKTAEEAHEYAKANPGIIIIRSQYNDGFVIKK